MLATRDLGLGRLAIDDKHDILNSGRAYLIQDLLHISISGSNIRTNIDSAFRALAKRSANRVGKVVEVDMVEPVIDLPITSYGNFHNILAQFVLDRRGIRHLSQVDGYAITGMDQRNASKEQRDQDEHHGREGRHVDTADEVP